VKRPMRCCHESVCANREISMGNDEWLEIGILVAGYTGIGRDIPVFHRTYPFVIGYTGMSQDILVCPGPYGYIPGQTPVRRDKPLLNGQTHSIDTGLPARKPDITQPMTVPAHASPGNDRNISKHTRPQT
jgi:hypothetical protein